MMPSHSTSQDASAGAPAETDCGPALGRIPSGLFVVTWRDAEADRGMLASWVMQAGFAPPMVSLAVAPGRGLMAAIDAAHPFVVNVLAESQRPLLGRFAKAAEDPFEGLAVTRTPAGVAVLADVAAWLECRAVSRTGGTDAVRCDHELVLARVVAAGGGDREPLVHVRKNGLRY